MRSRLYLACLLLLSTITSSTEPPASSKGHPAAVGANQPPSMVAGTSMYPDQPLVDANQPPTSLKRHRAAADANQPPAMDAGSMDSDQPPKSLKRHRAAVDANQPPAMDAGTSRHPDQGTVDAVQGLDQNQAIVVPSTKMDQQAVAKVPDFIKNFAFESAALKYSGFNWSVLNRDTGYTLDYELLLATAVRSGNVHAIRNIPLPPNFNGEKALSTAVEMGNLVPLMELLDLPQFAYIAAPFKAAAWDPHNVFNWSIRDRYPGHSINYELLLDTAVRFGNRHAIRNIRLPPNFDIRRALVLALDLANANEEENMVPLMELLNLHRFRETTLRETTKSALKSKSVKIFRLLAHADWSLLSKDFESKGLATRDDRKFIQSMAETMWIERLQLEKGKKSRSARGEPLKKSRFSEQQN